MRAYEPLAVADLCHHSDPTLLPFGVTAELETLDTPLGQERAVEAIELFMEMRQDGYNLFVIGPSGTGKHATVRRLLEEGSTVEPCPPDWCYVHDFQHPQAPRALNVPAGRGRELVRDMDRLVEELRAAIPAAFETEQYRARLQEIEDEFKERQEKAWSELEQTARDRRLAVIRMPSGVVFAPIRDGEVLGPDDFAKLSEDEQARIKDQVTELQTELTRMLRQVPLWGKQTRDKLKELNREVTRFAVEQTIDELMKRYRDLPDVSEFLDQVRRDVIDNADDFRKEDAQPNLFSLAGQGGDFLRYRVNLLVDRADCDGAPVVYEDRPTVERLVGRIEHRSQFGNLVSDFTLIKAGALHRANGGSLILDARKVLTSPYAWEALKRALFSKEIRIESLSGLLGLSGTPTLEPTAIPLRLKIVLIGDRRLYYLLNELDPELSELFKVLADFEEQVDRTEENIVLYSRLIARLAQERGLRPLESEAVARIFDHAARLAGDSEKLSVDLRTIGNVLKEADHRAAARGAATTAEADVSEAIGAQIRRQSRLRERVREQILKRALMIDTTGARVGQVNGLSVIALGQFPFGHPTRITATARVGDGKVVDIEREVELGGSLHSKGVLILSNFLASRYARQFPLSLSASLVFEQSYSGVEGDSASLGELCALVSALAQVPIKQSIAVTGSVNQLGRVQPIGGVNEKVEGFFDVCKARGLSGEHGVVIPKSNVVHLMLRDDVVEACAAGTFHVYAVESVDEAIEILTGAEAGESDENGEFPDGSINGKSMEQLMEFAVVAEGFSKLVKIESEDEKSGD